MAGISTALGSLPMSIVADTNWPVFNLSLGIVDRAQQQGHVFVGIDNVADPLDVASIDRNLGIDRQANLGANRPRQGLQVGQVFFVGVQPDAEHAQVGDLEQSPPWCRRIRRVPAFFSTMVPSIGERISTRAQSAASWFALALPLDG